MKVKQILKDLEAALDSAKMDQFAVGSVEHSNMIREETRIYRQTWIIPRIERAIRLIKGEKE